MDAAPATEQSDEEEQPLSAAELQTITPCSSANRPSGSSPGARLGLHFAGGNGANSRNLCWRDGRFSDWTVKVGDKTYNLHAFLLARASLFFDRHISFAARNEAADGPTTRGSDLTEVLPQVCHGAFEDTLDFIYSENQAIFDVPASKALLLLKIADILLIAGLFEAMGRRIEAAFSDTAPLLLEQYCQFHVPGTDDGAALRKIREGAIELIVRKFQPFLAIPEMRKALLQLPAGVLAEILEADDLLVANEDVVCGFVCDRLEAIVNAENADDSDAASAAKAWDGSAQEEHMPLQQPMEERELWSRVRWAFPGAVKFDQAMSLGEKIFAPQAITMAYKQRCDYQDLRGAQGIPPPMPRRPILPPGVPPPNSTEIDFCFHYRHAEQFQCGEALRSQPKKIGDLVLRVLVFPSGTDTGVAPGSLSVFLEAVPQPGWSADWEFANVRYAIACIRWPTGSGESWAAKRKSDQWTFKANRLDRGWHDFLAPGEIHRYLGPEGFVCIRGSLEPGCLGQAFLLTSQASHAGCQGPPGEAAGSSSNRRGGSWARGVPAMPLSEA